MARPRWILAALLGAVVLGACSSPRSAPPSGAGPPAAAAPTPQTPPAASPLASAVEAEAPPSIPEFPWPPPAASARQVIPPDVLAGGHRLSRLGDVDAVLSEALELTGYAEKSYWAVPKGFAVATRLEQIEANGKSRPPPARWSAEMPRLTGPFSLGAYLRALFTAEPGYYRIVVFIVTEASFSEAEESISAEEARSWGAHGLKALPDSIAARAYHAGVVCTAMIYQFERRPGRQAEPLVPSPLDARAHLVQSGLWRALEGR